MDNYGYSKDANCRTVKDWDLEKELPSCLMDSAARIVRSLPNCVKPKAGGGVYFDVNCLGYSALVETVSGVVSLIFSFNNAPYKLDCSYPQ